MFSVRVKGVDSWLDPESAGILGWKLGKRLWDRCKGHEGRFITLTYNREPYADAQDCFDQARSRKHVSRFMRKLGNLLGHDLKGKWICKMEFQQGGWVHWHILLLDIGFIKPELFSQIFDLWGRGGINIKPLTEENTKYLTKYVAKDGTVPGWLYGYPPRSIKVVRPSAGFWNDEQARIARERTAERKAKAATMPRNQPEEEKKDFYVPVGERIKREHAVVRVGEKAFTINGDRHRLLRALREHCGEPVFEGTWRHYDESPEVLAAVVAQCEGYEQCEPERPASEDRNRSKPVTRSWRPLFLRGIGKRAGWWMAWWKGKYRTIRPEMIEVGGKLAKWWAKHAPWYIQLSWEQEARYDMGMDMHGERGWPPDAVVTVS